MMDLSPLRKFEVIGPDAEALLQYVFPRDVTQARRRPGRLHRHVLRAWRHDRRRHAVPPRARTISAGSAATTAGVHLDQGAGRQDRRSTSCVKTATDQIHNVAVQGPKSRDILRTDRLDAAGRPSIDELGMVPLHRRPHRRSQRHPGRRLAHRLYRRTRLRGLLPPQRCARSLGRDHGSWPAARHLALRLRRARHGAHRSRPGLRRLRLRQQTDPFEAGIGFTVPPKKEEDLHRQGRAGTPPRQTRRASSSAWKSPATRRLAMATASMSAAPRSASSPAACARRS